MKKAQLFVIHLLILVCHVCGVSASNAQVVSESVNPGRGMINSILFPYYPKRDGDYQKLRDYIVGQATSTTVSCTSDGKVPLEDSAKLIERMCNQKQPDCCVLLALKSPKQIPEAGLTTVNDSCFVKGNGIACFALFGPSKKTTDVLAAASKACDLGSGLACMLKASISLGLKKDETTASKIFDEVCRAKNSGVACYMAYLHADRIKKDKLEAAQYLKDACRLGFKYGC